MRSKLLIAVFLHFSYACLAQQNDSTKKIINFKSAIAVTNNGFSLIPSFTLGKPAAIFNFTIGGKKLSFEPEFRFSLAGKPWSFIFIWRYKLINTNKFQLSAGVHLPGLAFRTISVVNNGVTKNVIQTQRFVSPEIFPTYFFSKNISTGLYYLYAHGLEKDATQHTQFITFRVNFLNIPIYKQIYARFTPQAFYLSMDAKDGFYTGANLTIAKHNSPFSISTIVNKQLRTSIVGKDFNWNISLNYALSKNFIRQ